MLRELGRAFLLTILAEMGDKTQIIAMTFATQYSIKEVLLGVLIGILCNHGLAILLGRVFSKIIPMNYIQVFIGLIFIVFGYLSLGDEEVGDDESKKAINPIMTVALTFFIGELGDKSQLTAMGLSAEAMYPILILIGTTMGMLVTSGMGIFVGSKLGDKIPDLGIKLVSSLVFVGFGSHKLIDQLGFDKMRLPFIIIIIVELILIVRLVKSRRDKKLSPMQLAAKKLYEQTSEIKESLDKLCLGEDICGGCSKNECLVGYIRDILSKARENEDYTWDSYKDIDHLIGKELELSKVIQSLALIVTGSNTNDWPDEDDFVVNGIANYLEKILFADTINTSLKLTSDYIEECKGKDLKHGLELERIIKSKE